MVVGIGDKHTQLRSLPMTCLACNNQSVFQIEKATLSTFLIIIPFWSTEYFATCSNCKSSFQLDKRKMQQLEYQLKLGKPTDWSGGRIPDLKEYIDKKDY